MRKYILLTTIATVVLAGIAYAADCISVSDSVTETKCKDLGYTMTASQCSGKNMVKCPLNTNWVWCGDGTAVPPWNYTISDKSKAKKGSASCTENGTTYYAESCSGYKSSYPCDAISEWVSNGCEAVDGTKYGICDCTSEQCSCSSCPANTQVATTSSRTGKFKCAPDTKYVCNDTGCCSVSLDPYYSED